MSKCTQTENHKTTKEANSKRAKGRASCAGKPRWGEVGRERAAARNQTLQLVLGLKYSQKGRFLTQLPFHLGNAVVITGRQMRQLLKYGDKTRFGRPGLAPIPGGAALAERGCTNTDLESACRRRAMSARCQALTGEIRHLCWEPTHGSCRELFSVSWCSVTASFKLKHSILQEIP